MFSLFLTYMYLHIIACSDLNISGICPAIVDAKHISQKVVNHLNCCPNFHVENNICTPCPAGWYGKKCKEKCLSNYYGSLRKQRCNCSLNEICNNVYGCVCEDSSNCLDREYMYKSKTDMFNGDNDTLPTTMNTWTTEESLPLIYVYMISVSTALLLVLLARASVSCLRNTRKRFGRESQMFSRKNNRKSASDRPVSNAMELKRVSCMSSASASRYKALYKNQYCEPWGATSSV